MFDDLALSSDFDELEEVSSFVSSLSFQFNFLILTKGFFLSFFPPLFLLLIFLFQEFGTSENPPKTPSVSLPLSPLV